MNTNEQMRNMVSLDAILNQLSEEKVQLVTVVAGTWVDDILALMGSDEVKLEDLINMDIDVPTVDVNINNVNPVIRVNGRGNTVNITINCN